MASETLTQLLLAEKPLYAKRVRGVRQSAHTLTRKYASAAYTPFEGTSCWHEEVETLKQACFQGYPESARYVQISIGSRNSAIHNAYRTSLRPSSSFEPRHPSLKVVSNLISGKPTGNDVTVANEGFKVQEEAR